MDRSKIGLLFISLFALPFAAFGLFALSRAVPQLLSGAGDSQVWLGLLFGVVFSSIGLGLILVGFYGAKLNQRQQRLEAEFPGQPWKWRFDWATGRINSNTRSDTIGAWAFAILWNLISSPVLFFAPHEAARKGPIVYVSLVFPVVGMFLLVRAVRLSLELHEFGRTCFEMSSVPGVVGHELKGNLQVRFPRPPDHGIHLRLSCVQRTLTGSGNSQSTTERILWRGESTVSATQLYAGPAATMIPVSFHIPYDAQPTEKRTPRDMTLWLLEAQADVPGVDYHDVFEVPVFHTAQSPAEPEAGTSETEPDAPAEAKRPENPTIQVRASTGGTEFYFPAARNKSFAASTTVFCLIFCGAAYLMARGHVIFIFPIAFGGFGLLLLYITLQMWLATSRVVIGNGMLSVQDGWLGSGKVRTLAFGEIEGIRCNITAQGGGTGTPYYDLELIKKAGGKVTLGRTLREKDEAEWLASEMRSLIGLEPKAMAAAGGSIFRR
jgi:hypothetical protein